MANNKRRTRVLSACLAGLLAAPLVAGGAVAQAADPTGAAQAAPPQAAERLKVTADGWIHYPSRLERIGAPAQRTAHQGQRGAAGGCTVSGEADDGASAAGITFTEEIAYNPQTCQSVVATSTLTPEQAAELAASKAPSSTVPDVSSLSPHKPSSSIGTAATYSRWLRTAWVDPIEIDISSQKSGFRWTGTGWSNGTTWRNSFKGCISGVCLDETYIVSQSHLVTAITGGWRYNARTHFRNTSFAKWVVAFMGASGWAACGFPTSWTANFHHNTNIEGLRTGAARWNWADSKNGACTNLVHHESSTGVSY